MNPASEDIKDLLAAESSLALTFNTDLFVSLMPDTAGIPDDIVVVLDTPGFPPESYITPGSSGMYYPSLMIRVRNNDYQDGWDIIDAIKVFLDGKCNFTQGGAYYTSISCSGEPFPLERDSKNRTHFVCNFNLQRREAS